MVEQGLRDLGHVVLEPRLASRVGLRGGRAGVVGLVEAQHVTVPLPTMPAIALEILLADCSLSGWPGDIECGPRSAG